MTTTCENCITRPQLNAAISKVKLVATAPTLIAGEYGGTGVKNKGKKIVLGGNLTIDGTRDVIMSAPQGGVSNVILPESGIIVSAVVEEIQTANGKIGKINSKPTPSTYGTPGQILAYVYDKNKNIGGSNSFAASLYICTGVSGNVYSWMPVSINIGEPLYN